jgi:hypothetical protein
MRTILVLFILILADFARADWVCADHASVLKDDGEITICGEAWGMGSDEAKKWAFHQAHLEFWRMCMASSTCKGYEVSIVPGRMECSKVKAKFKDYLGREKWACKRAVTFVIDRSKEQCRENLNHPCQMNRMPDDGV